jgi:hypothetical protein
MSATPEQAIDEAIKLKKKTATKAERKAKVTSQTNFDDTYGFASFPFLEGKDKDGKKIVGDGSIANAPRIQPIRIKVSTLKIGRIDTGGATGDGYIEQRSSQIAPSQQIKVSFGASLRTRKPSKTTRSKTAKQLSAKYYSKNWIALSVPTSATSLDIISWIKKNWGVQPLELRVGQTVYQITKRKKAINTGKSNSKNATAIAAAATAGKA